MTGSVVTAGTANRNQLRRTTMKCKVGPANGAKFEVNGKVLHGVRIIPAQFDARGKVIVPERRVPLGSATFRADGALMPYRETTDRTMARRARRAVKRARRSMAWAPTWADAP